MAGVPSQLQARNRAGQAPWHGAYLVEALLLLAALAATVAVLMSVFALAARRGDEAVTLGRATQLATATAERFCADPAQVPSEVTEDGLRVTCEVEPERTAAGTLYHATVSVWSDTGEQVFSLTTARYVGGEA